MKSPILAVMFFILSGLLSPLLTLAQASTLNDSTIFLLAQNNRGLDRASHSIKQKTGGRILSAKTVTEKGRRVYKIKVLMPSGKVKIFKINAN